MPKDRNKLWSNSEAIQFTTCTFGMWDGSDNKTSGLHNFKFPTSQNSSLSARTGFFFASREGCDGKPGSGRKYDACGKCGGDGQSCRGCDGVLHSGAKFGKSNLSVSIRFTYQLHSQHSLMNTDAY